MVTRVQKWGNSQGLRFAKSVLGEARINVGDQVRVSVQEGRIIVEPVSRVRGRHDLRARYPECRRSTWSKRRIGAAQSDTVKHGRFQQMAGIKMTLPFDPS